MKKVLCLLTLLLLTTTSWAQTSLESGFCLGNRQYFTSACQLGSDSTTDGVSSQYFTDGTGKASVTFDGNNNVIIKTITNDDVRFGVNNSELLRLNANVLIPSSNGGLGLGDATYGFDQLYMSDGTEKLTIDFASTIPQIITTDAYMYLGVSNSRELTFSSSALYPYANDGIALGTSSAGYSDAYFASGAKILGVDNGAMFVGMNSADGSDDSALILTGSNDNNVARGAYGIFYGNEHVSKGDVLFYTGNAVGSSAYLGLMASNSSFYIIDDASQTLWTFEQDGDSTIHIDGAKIQSDDDASSWYLTGGNGTAITDGATILLTGDDYTGSNAGGYSVWESGDNAGSHILLDINHASAFVGIRNTSSSTVFSVEESGDVVITGVAVASLPASCVAGAIHKATDSDDCSAGGGNGALCVCNNAGNGWVLLLNY